MLHAPLLFHCLFEKSKNCALASKNLPYPIKNLGARLKNDAQIAFRKVSASTISQNAIQYQLKISLRMYTHEKVYCSGTWDFGGVNHAFHNDLNQILENDFKN